MTVARAGVNIDKATIKTFVVKSGSTVAKGVGVFFTATEGEIDVAVANSKVAAVALETVVGDGVLKAQVALLDGGVALVKVSASGATRGEYAICGTDGFENQTIGGGTTVKYIAGQFLETGVDNDYIAMRLHGFAAGCA